MDEDFPPGTGSGCNQSDLVKIAFGVPLPPYKYYCSPGFYCPNTNSSNPSSLPVICIPSTHCQIQRLASIPCQPQGLYEPTICPPGFYCPDFNSKYPCPIGSYCPAGSISPTPCNRFASCPVQSKLQSFYGGLLLCLLLDLFLLFTLIAQRYYQTRKSKTHWSTMLPSIMRQSCFKYKFIKCDEDEPAAMDMKNLVKYFAKEVGQKDLVPMMFEFRNMGLVLDSGVEILHNVGGRLIGGRMTALVGPSGNNMLTPKHLGAGKTTLLNLLLGKAKRTSGTVFINGVETEIHSMKKVIGYVPQEDIMLREMTVRENIMHSARIRLSGSLWKSFEIDEFVDTIIQVLGLSSVAHSIIGDENCRGISGGQRKRVNIAIELASAPLALFLDEPTSGLDATSSLQVVSILKELSKIGITVTSVIHQPRVEIFEKFDDILLLLPGGKTAYHGSVKDVVPYFKNIGYKLPDHCNPADIIMDILSGKFETIESAKYGPSALQSLWEEQSNVERLEPMEGDQNKVIQTLIKHKCSSFVTQVYLCSKRSFIQQSRRLGSLWLEIFVGLIAGLLMGLATPPSRDLFSGVWIPPYTTLSPAPLTWAVALLGMLIGMSCSLAAAPAGVIVFGEETIVYCREAASGHSRLAYYIAKTISAIPRLLLSSLHFSSILFFMVKPLVPFNILYILIALQFYGVYGISCCVSLLVRRENAPLLAVIVCLIVAVFCGYAPTLTEAKQGNFFFFFEIMYNKWASEALYGEWTEAYKHVYLIDIAAEYYGYTMARTGLCIGMMVLIGTVWRIFGFFLLIGTNLDKQR